MRISGTDPFALGCGVPGVQPGAEAGPVIAVSPRSPRHLVVAWEQDPSDRYSPLSIITAVSKNGGENWRRAQVFRISRCTGAENWYASDPSLAIGPDGTTYLGSLASSFDTSAVQVSRSLDGGLNWAKPVHIAFGALPGGVAADPAKPGTAYVAATQAGTGGSDILFSLTTDGGESWSAPTSIETPLGANPIADELLALPDGSLLLVYRQPRESLIGGVAEDLRRQLGGTGSPIPVLASRTTDQGKTWSPPTKVGEIPDLGFPHDPEKGSPGGTEGRINARSEPSAALGSDGTVYVTWAEVSAKDAARIVISKSSDQGASWSSPEPVATVAAQALLPALAAAPAGAIGVSWLDFRNDKPGDEALTADVWLAHSHDGSAWSQAHLAGPFDLRKAPEHFGHFVGFAQGLVPLADGFGATFVQTPPRAADGPSDVYFTLGSSRARLRLTVKPNRVRAGQRRRFEFAVSAIGSKGKRRPVAGATIAFAGSRARTDRRGKARISKRFGSPGRQLARATKRGFRSGSVPVRVTR